MTFILFIIAACAFPILDTKGPGAKGFLFIYFFSSFWIQFGPNSTTFLLAAEVYPGPVRATAHGFSAAVGKLGALAATVLYNYIGSRPKFWVVFWFGLIGFLLTVVFIPDTTGLDLAEQRGTGSMYAKAGRTIIMALPFIDDISRGMILWSSSAMKPMIRNSTSRLRSRTCEICMRRFSAQSANEAEKGDADARTLLGESGSAYFEREKKTGQKTD